MKTRFFKGQMIDGKKLICYTTNVARSEYYLTFEDKSREIVKVKK